MHTRIRGSLGLGFALGAAAVPFAACSSSSSSPNAIGDNPGSDGSTLPDTTTDTGSRPDHESTVDAPPGDHTAPSDASEGGVLTCDGGMVMCEGICTNTQTDPNNCGTCNHGCGMSVGMVCSGGSCACNLDAGLSICGLNCVDTQTDSTNCGTCGHDCQGSMCSGGFCVTAVAATATSAIWGLAVTPDSLFWTQPGPEGQGMGIVAQKPFGSGTSVATVATSLAYPKGIAVDTIYAYWVGNDDRSVTQTELLGGPLVSDWPFPIADGGSIPDDQPLAIASDGASIFWVSYLDGAILTLPQGNPSEATPRIVYSGGHHPLSIAVDGANVYWSEQGTAVPPDYNGCIYQINKNATNGTPTKLTPDCAEANPNTIAIDQNGVYWVDHLNGGWVKAVPIGGGAVTTLASGEGGPYGIATIQGDPYVYWTDDTDNTVKKVLKAGGSGQTPTVLALNQLTPQAIVVDEKNVYWVNQQANAIYEVSK